MTIRVLITDDHGVVRQGLRMFLSRDPEVEVVGEAANGRDAVDMARGLEPDVVLMDLLMPVMDGIEATGEIRRKLPEVEVMALTSVLEDASVTGAIQAEAIGYLLRTADVDELCEAIRAAARGQAQLAPEAAARLMHEEVRVPESPEALTERETEVLELIARGKTNNRITHELFIGEATIKSHVHSILSKLNVSSDLVPAEFVMLLTFLFSEVLDGRNAHLTDGVQRALGREPRDFADYARDAAATGVWDGG